MSLAAVTATLGVPGADVGVVLSDPQRSACLSYICQGTRTPEHVHHISCVVQFTILNRLNNNNHRQVHTLGCPSPGPSWGGGFGAVAAGFWGARVVWGRPFSDWRGFLVARRVWPRGGPMVWCSVHCCVHCLLGSPVGVAGVGHGLTWTRDWTRLDWAGLGWARRGWAGLDWTGLGGAG